MKKRQIILGAVFLLFVSFSVNLIYAEKLGIEMGDSYVPGEDIKFKLVLYDDENNKIDGDVNYIIQDYYTEIVGEGKVNSGEEVVFKLPENAVQGPWKVIVSYDDIEINGWFNVGELEKAEIKLERDVLVIKNIGNTVYEKRILIFIGQDDQTAQIFLEVGQEKKIRLTAPDGNYDIRVIEGNEENILEFEGVKLTGNVIGLESVLGKIGFWRKYPMVGVFLVAVVLVAIIVGVLKFRKKA